MVTFLLLSAVMATAPQEVPRIVNPCKTTAVSFIKLAPDRVIITELEPRRFAAITGDHIEYNLGWKKITIRADSRIVQEFFDDVAHGRCGLNLKVKLTPVYTSPFNTTYKATYRMWLHDGGAKGHKNPAKQRKD